MMNGQRSDTEKCNLIEMKKVKKIGIDEFIKHKSLNSQI